MIDDGEKLHAPNTDKECDTITLICQHVMGWHLWRGEHLTLDPVSFYMIDYKSRIQVSKPHKPWYTSLFTHEEWFSVWHPGRDANHATQVFNRIRELGYQIRMETNMDRLWFQVWDNADHTLISSNNVESFENAVYLMALNVATQRQAQAFEREAQ